ncbi:electron transfer flavoprotein subunit alpha/FixB family protein [candidate division KSB1 bacterium]|nr:electron transfer flavoprotein subunit alpha/FixB family protein [candidate division KSB1 bacterium]
MSAILVITEYKNGEIRKPSLEVLGEARRAANGSGAKVVALVIGSGIDGSGLGAYGADVVLTADHDALASYNPDFYKTVAVQAVKSQNADVELMAATDMGKDLASRIAAKLDAGLASDCLSLEIGDALTAKRPMYAGKAIATVAVKSAIKIATLRPNMFAVEGPDESKSAAVEALELPELTSKQTVKEVRSSSDAKMDLTEADVIVTGGRGMKDPANFVMLEELADLLGGVSGATRAAVDAGWCPQSDQVGQTGKTVSPNLYFMIGASGSIQHWAGMSNAKCIVAVNKDTAAPIMEKADYSIVGDLFEVVPAMIEEIKKIRG